jgi:ATP-dependent protease ClpP protease subunit
VDGVAASAASFIAMAGDSIKMAPQSMMMIHDAAGLVIGNADDMREMAALLEKTSDNIAAVYAQRAKGTQEDWRAAMKAETWYTDQEAVDAGLADEILSEDEPQQQPKNAVPEPFSLGFDLLSAVKEALK